MNKIKIAFITYSLSGGGTERRIVNLVNYLTNKNIKVDIVLLKHINDYAPEYRTLFKKINMFYLTNYKKRIPRIIMPFVIIGGFIRFISLIRKQHYSLLLGFDYYSWYLIFFISKLFPIKNIIVVGVALSYKIKEFNTITQNFHKIFFKLFFNQTNKIICISKGLAYDLERFFSVDRKKIIVIYNGVDIKRIRQSIRNIRKSRNKTIILTCGRLVEQKGHKYLINAFSILNKKHPNTKLIILGKGPLKESLEKQIKRLSLQNKVFLPGFKNNPYPYFKKASIFVLSSLYEGFANVLIEAMVCGLSIISTDCPYGPREILCQDNNYKIEKKILFCKYGFLIPLFNTEPNNIINALVNAMTIALEKPSINKKLYIDAIDRFRLERMGKNYLSLINQLLQHE